MTIPAGRDLYFDHESDGLLAETTKLHCLAITDLRSGDEHYFGPPVPEGHKLWTPALGNPTGTIEDGLKALSEARMTVAHNGITHDYPVNEKLYPGWKRCPKAWDSFVAAKVVWPYDTLLGPDLKLAERGILPRHMMKLHSLKAWGYRLGENKDEYDGDRDKYPEPSDRPAKAGDERFDRRWEEWNPYLASYMMQDNRPGVKLWHLIEERLGWTDKLTAVTWPELAIEVEHEVARILDLQERDGVHFNIEKARALEVDLLNQKARLDAALVDTFGSWWQPSKVTYPTIARNVKREDLPYVTRERISEKTGKRLADYQGPVTEGYQPDAPFTPVERVTFSPSSRDHLGQRLQAVFKWRPKKFGANGKPTVDETVLEEIPEGIVPKETRRIILDYFVVAKTLGMLSKGQKAWLRLVDENSRIHGRMDSAGAITGRGTHKNPNLSQVPSVLKEKVTLPDGTKTEQIVKGLAGRYGWECRELIEADPGWEQTGVDASSLELIDLGHYLYPLDGGAFSSRVCDPTRDPHQENADLADMTRADAKTAIYLFVYGGGAYKLSLSLTVDEIEQFEYITYRGLPMLLTHLAKRFDQAFVDNLDDNQKARIAKARTIIVKFEKNITGLKDLIANVSEAAGKGWLRGLDGRKLIVRKAYSALNTLLQSAGAQTCKLWMMLVHRELERRGLQWGRDYRQILWVHDELQFTHRPGLGPVIQEVAKVCLKEAGVILNLRGEYRGDGKTGANWAECH